MTGDGSDPAVEHHLQQLGVLDRPLGRAAGCRASPPAAPARAPPPGRRAAGAARPSASAGTSWSSRSRPRDRPGRSATGIPGAARTARPCTARGRYVGSPTTVGCQMTHVTSFWIGRRRSSRSVASYIWMPLRAMSVPRSTSSVSNDGDARKDLDVQAEERRGARDQRRRIAVDPGMAVRREAHRSVRDRGRDDLGGHPAVGRQTVLAGLVEGPELRHLGTQRLQVLRDAVARVDDERALAAADHLLRLARELVRSDDAGADDPDVERPDRLNGRVGRRSTDQFHQPHDRAGALLVRARPPDRLDLGRDLRVAVGVLHRRRLLRTARLTQSCVPEILIVMLGIATEHRCLALSRSASFSGSVSADRSSALRS